MKLKEILRENLSKRIKTIINFLRKRKAKYIHSSLKSINIKHIDILKVDTFDIKNKFFSARRALKLKHNDYGRNISIIMLN